MFDITIDCDVHHRPTFAGGMASGLHARSKLSHKGYYVAVKKRWVSAMVFVAALVVLYIYWRLTR